MSHLDQPLFQNAPHGPSDARRDAAGLREGSRQPRKSTSAP